MAWCRHRDSKIAYRIRHIGSQQLARWCEAEPPVRQRCDKPHAHGGSQQPQGGTRLTLDRFGKGAGLERTVRKTIGDFKSRQRSDDLADPIAPDHLRKLCGAEIGHRGNSYRLIRGHSLSAKGRNTSSPRTVLMILTRSQGPVDSAGALIWVRYMS
jgi:hypothetical protein